jgi:adenylate cyclase
MSRVDRRRRQAALLVLALTGAAALALWLAPAAVTRWQDRGLDALIRLSPPPQPAVPVLVVDIGGADEAGGVWTRATSARLAGVLAGAQPAAVGWDIVFSGDCDAVDPTNAALARAIAASPTALGFLLSPQPSPPAPSATLAVANPAPSFWATPGAELPCPELTASAGGIGSVSLPGDQTARVRMAPAAVRAGDSVLPSLPLETLRLAEAATLPLIGGTPPTLRLGERLFPLDPAAMLRFRPSPLAERQARTLDAAALLAGQGVERLQGAVVLVGSSLPSRGGLRPTAEDPLYPSVQIAADLVAGLSAGRLPWRPAHAPATEALALAAAGTLLAALALRLPPLRALAFGAGLALLWSGSAAAAHLSTGRLHDPILPPLALMLALTAGLLLQAAASFRAERALRARIGQLLPGPVVARLADDPALLRLTGERRQVTALFTDIEGFSTLANRLEPEALIATLDRYFTEVSAIILRHGGMIDKIVGDGVHALFNAPLDQPDHINAALSAAAEIVMATEALRPALTLGRTRIGVETGPAILGDVGSGARIDYTAHGPAVNLAARLQEAAKTLGPAIIIGPAAAAATTHKLHPLGTTEVRSFGPLDLYTLA